MTLKRLTLLGVLPGVGAARSVVLIGESTHQLGDAFEILLIRVFQFFAKLAKLPKEIAGWRLQSLVIPKIPQIGR